MRPLCLLNAEDRHQGVIASVDKETRHTKSFEELAGRGGLPIMLHCAEAVQQCGKRIVKGSNGLGLSNLLEVKESWELLPFEFGLLLHGSEKHLPIDESVEALIDGITTSCQVNRG